MHSKLTVVLAHGAWSDGSSWSKVIAALAAQGVRSVTAALPLTGLNEDVAALDRTLEHVCGPVVLAGHAYAGAVIGATRHASVKALVYVAALAPAQGETVADVFYRGEPHPLAPKLAPDAQGLIWFPEEAFPLAFAPNASAQENVILAAAQRPPSLPCLTTPAPRPRWLDAPAWYLLAKQDRMILEGTQRFMAERMKAHIAEYDVDHTPAVTAPQTVVDTILQAVRAAA